MRLEVKGIKRHRRWGTYGLAVIGIYFAVYTLGCAVLSFRFSEPPKSATVLFVLGGGRSTEREKAACACYQPGQRVVLSGNVADDLFLKRVEYIKQCGVPEEKIDKVLSMTNTAGEWEAAKRMAHDGEAVAVVSDPPHMGRLFLLRLRDGTRVTLVSDAGWYGHFVLTGHGLSFLAKEPVKFWWYLIRHLWQSS